MTWQLTRQVNGLYGRNTWQHGRLTGGVRRANVAHTWANQMLTRVMMSLVGKGAMWPNPGLPRGTPLLVDRFEYKRFVASGIRNRNLLVDKGPTGLG